MRLNFLAKTLKKKTAIPNHQVSGNEFLKFLTLCDGSLGETP
jgi:hypothetical protein